MPLGKVGKTLNGAEVLLNIGQHVFQLCGEFHKPFFRCFAFLNIGKKFERQCVFSQSVVCECADTHFLMNAFQLHADFFAWN